jgi:3-hydroxy-5-methyl-1-naphthoate 3-O-methyltransferase
MDPYKELTLYQRSAALMAAAKLGVFLALEEGAQRPSEVAQRVMAPTDTISRLLVALSSLDYLSREGDQFALNDFSKAFLREGAGGMARLAWKEHLFYTVWSQLSDAIVSGRAVFPPFRDRLANDFPSIERFLLALNDLAEAGAPGVLQTGAFRGARTILDLGGGGGGYAGELARALPDARVTLADLREIIPIAERHLIGKGIQDRVELVAADFLKDGCGLEGRTFDCVFLSHVLHDFDPSTASTIVRRACSLLRRGGKLVILDVLVPDEGQSDSVEALFDLMMLVEIPEGRTHRLADIRRWIESAGMASPKSHKLYFGSLLESETIERGCRKLPAQTRPSSSR